MKVRLYDGQTVLLKVLIDVCMRKKCQKVFCNRIYAACRNNIVCKSCAASSIRITRIGIVDGVCARTEVSVSECVIRYGSQKIGAENSTIHPKIAKVKDFVLDDCPAGARTANVLVVGSWSGSVA